MTGETFPELGFYALPGHVENPEQIFDEIATGESVGLGSAWISERLNTKEIGVLSGIALAQSKRMAIATGLIANLTLRHPLTVAGFGATMMRLSRGRFALGVGRGVDGLSDAAGVPRLNFNLLRHYVDILQRLWRGEVVDYDGPLGRMRSLTIGGGLNPAPPILMAAMGPKAAYFAGGLCDGMILDSLWSKAAVAESVRLARQGARDAGRDPERLRVWAILVTACETSEEVVLLTVIRRIYTYILFPKLFDLICEANGWDKGVAADIRQAMADSGGAARRGTNGDEHVSNEIDDLRRLRALIPEQWITEGCAVGDAETCAQLTLERFDAGADGVLFHGSSPGNLAPLLRRWSQIRPAQRFVGRSSNPGL